MITELQRKDIDMNTTLKDILDATLPVVEREIKVNVFHWRTDYLLDLVMTLYYKMADGKTVRIISEPCIGCCQTREALIDEYIESVKRLLGRTEEPAWPYWVKYNQAIYGEGQIVFRLDRK